MMTYLIMIIAVDSVDNQSGNETLDKSKFHNSKDVKINSGAPAARRAAKRSPISIPYMGNKRKPMS